jgi:hypothetical protein
MCMSAVIPMELGAVESVFQASNFPLLLLVGVKRIACKYLEVIYAACVSKTLFRTLFLINLWHGHLQTPICQPVTENIYLHTVDSTR